MERDIASAEVKRLLNACGTDLAGLRDRALFLTDFAGALQHCELVAIDREHLRFIAEGTTMFIPRSKRDQEREGGQHRHSAGAESALMPSASGGGATDRSCPFDLQRLLPIPGGILQLGPDDPKAQIWLWVHWVTARALRHMRELPVKRDRCHRKMNQMEMEFWSADWPPRQPLRRLLRAWPGRTPELRPGR